MMSPNTRSERADYEVYQKTVIRAWYVLFLWIDPMSKSAADMFAACTKGKMFSVAWACKEQFDAMQACMNE